MKVLVRRKMIEVVDQEPVFSKQDVYEWSPAPDRWYTIHQRNIFFQSKNGDGREKNQLIANFYNALLQGLMVSAGAKYSRRTKILEIEL